MLENLNILLSNLIYLIQQNSKFLMIFMSIMFCVLILNKLTQGLINILGIIPRRIIGIPGIICSHFIHANFDHYFFNMIPLFVLGNFILIYGQNFFYTITLFIMIVSGSLLWLFGQRGIHVGASCLITGYWGFLVTNIQLNSPISILLGIISIYYFFGIFLGIFPGKRGVSWDGHLFGLVSGLLFSFFA